jgi:hypothetical protein
MPAQLHLSEEHHTRELLNVIMLLERCLALPDGAPREQSEWRADLAAARRRLDDLLSPARSALELTRRLATCPPPPVRPSQP